MNPKLKAAAAAVTKMINQEGALSFEELQALTDMSEMVLSAALNEMITTGIVTQDTNRATGNKKYVLTAKARDQVPAPEPEPNTKTKRPAKSRAKRFTPNPMLGAYEHKGNLVLKLERAASQCVTLTPEDAEIFVALLTRMIDIAKRRQVAQLTWLQADG